MGNLVNYSASQLALVKRTVAKDCNAAEFDWFIQICRATKLNPLTRDIYAFVFYKNDPEKRQLTPVTSIKGMRGIAARTGNYRPDSEPARIEYDEALKDDATNPLGIVKAEVAVYQFNHGDWHRVPGEAYWTEFAPVIKRDGKAMIDPKKDGWRKMPRLMIAKCAEAQALRRAWPDDMETLVEQSEIDRGEVLDLTPTEMVETADQETRLQLVGAHAGVLIDWMDGKPLERVQDGQYTDRVLAFLRTCDGNPKRVTEWKERNRHSGNEFWARHKGEALELKKAIEAAEAQPAAPDPQMDLVEFIQAGNGVM